MSGKPKTSRRRIHTGQEREQIALSLFLRTLATFDLASKKRIIAFVADAVAHDDGNNKPQERDIHTFYVPKAALNG